MSLEVAYIPSLTEIMQEYILDLIKNNIYIIIICVIFGMWKIPRENVDLRSKNDGKRSQHEYEKYELQQQKKQEEYERQQQQAIKMIFQKFERENNELKAYTRELLIEVKEQRRQLQCIEYRRPMQEQEEDGFLDILNKTNSVIGTVNNAMLFGLLAGKTYNEFRK